jgi:hypothetical protein
MSYCEVDFSDQSEDADPVEFVDTRVVAARKPHKCSECGGAIVKGERHQVRAYKFEGEFYAERVCDPCREVAGEFGYSILGGGLWTHMADEWGQGARVQACINRLETARAKTHMRDRWLAWQDKERERSTAARDARPAANGDTSAQ